MPGGQLDISALDARLATIVRGRKVIVVTTVSAAANESVRQLADYGAQRPLVLAHSVGVGLPPSENDAVVSLHQLPRKPALMSEEVSFHSAFLADLPQPAIDAVEAYDPEGDALWWLMSIVEVPELLLGRKVLGGRRTSWGVLEDKTIGDQVFDAAGVRRPDSIVVRPLADELSAAARELDAGDGTVWSGDARDGVNGGGEFVRWVRTTEAAAAASEFFGARCRRVRVAPFLDGVPCSVHGVVLPEGVAVLRPVELLVLRGPADRFVYAGMATWWDPPDEDRVEMRSAARRLGEHLSASIGFRGGFSLDGVLTAEGWLPTEVNPRFAGGLTTIARGLPGLPLQMLQAALVAGIDVGLTADQLESGLLEAADERRNVVTHVLSTDLAPEQTTAVEIGGSLTGMREAGPGDRVIGSVEIGPSSMGGLVRFRPVDGELQTGERAAPSACALVEFADRTYGTRFGTCTPAPDVRRHDVWP